MWWWQSYVTGWWFNASGCRSPSGYSIEEFGRLEMRKLRGRLNIEEFIKPAIIFIFVSIYTGNLGHCNEVLSLQYLSLLLMHCQCESCSLWSFYSASSLPVCQCKQFMTEEIGLLDLRVGGEFLPMDILIFLLVTIPKFHRHVSTQPHAAVNFGQFLDIFKDSVWASTSNMKFSSSKS